MGELAVVDPSARPALVAGRRVSAIVPTTMDETYRLAKAVTAAGMAPYGLETPEKAMIAIMHGLEIGLTPMAALQRIAVIKGRPTIWGDAAMGIVRASGVCEWIKERVAGDGDARVATCEAKRKGDPEPVIKTFSVADAKRAGLWSPSLKVKKFKRDGATYEADNDSPWHRYPDRMMQMRARAFALRDLFADILGGMHLREEFDDEEPAATAPAPALPPTPPSPPTPPVPPTAIAPPVEPQPEPAAVQQSSEVDYADVMRRYREAIARASDTDALDDLFNIMINGLEHAPEGFHGEASAYDDARRAELEG